VDVVAGAAVVGGAIAEDGVGPAAPVGAGEGAGPGAPAVDDVPAGDVLSRGAPDGARGHGAAETAGEGVVALAIVGADAGRRSAT
jgi:hypothetical protein